MNKVRNRRLKHKKIIKFKKMRKGQLNSTAMLILSKSSNPEKMASKCISKGESNLVNKINREDEFIAIKDKGNMLLKEIIAIELYMRIKYTLKF